MGLRDAQLSGMLWLWEIVPASNTHRRVLLTRSILIPLEWQIIITLQLTLESRRLGTRDIVQLRLRSDCTRWTNTEYIHTPRPIALVPFLINIRHTSLFFPSHSQASLCLSLLGKKSLAKHNSHPHSFTKPLNRLLSLSLSHTQTYTNEIHPVLRIHPGNRPCLLPVLITSSISYPIRQKDLRHIHLVRRKRSPRRKYYGLVKSE